MKQYAHIASRVFEVPLAIREGKLVDITGYLVPRFRGDYMDDDDSTEAIVRSPMALESGIATIQICGTLISRSSGMDAMSGLTSYPDIQRDFERAINDTSVRGILFDVDSPGGEINGMYDLSDLIYKARGAKPIYAACDSVAASAAYVVCSAADRIFVRRSSIVGSIGIIALHLDQSGFDAQQGFKFTYVYAGARKKDYNSHEPLSDVALEKLQARIDTLYQLEVTTVGRNRNITARAIEQTESGDFLGQDAKGAGLADAMGTLDDATEALAIAINNPKISLVTARASTARAAIQPEGGTVVPEPAVVSTTQQAALSAAIPTQEGLMPEPKPADTLAVPAQTTNQATTQAVPATAGGAPPVDLTAVIAKAKSEAHAEFLAMLETCAIAGFSAKATLTHIKPDSTLTSVRTSVLAARADQPGGEISSHILPEAGVDVKRKPEDSPVVKAAERRAAEYAARRTN